ncbi:uncharacterized protein LOC135579298 isoform X3 [Columba livia]|uniref:uncharacterized protein LOC135579298 isoform X3 n=1 Tax=Columba livia TaxID=8932 RepID=UPI0031B9D79B
MGGATLQKRAGRGARAAVRRREQRARSGGAGEEAVDLQFQSEEKQNLAWPLKSSFNLGSGSEYWEFQASSFLWNVAGDLDNVALREHLTERRSKWTGSSCTTHRSHLSLSPSETRRSKPFAWCLEAACAHALLQGEGGMAVTGHIEPQGAHSAAVKPSSASAHTCTFSLHMQI